MFDESLKENYKEDVDNLRLKASQFGFSNSEIDEIFSSCFNILEKTVGSNVNTSKPERIFYRIFKYFAIFITILLISYIILNVHQPTASVVLRNVQNLIYPALKLLRYVAVPIIKQYPSLTELYDESCLLENPFFYVYDMECWPCEEVHSVIDLTGFNNQSLYQSGIPYIVKTHQKLITYTALQQLYLNHTEVFKKNANKLKSSNKFINSVQDLEVFYPNTTKSSKTHISWRINRMGPGRLIRSLFPRPYFISEWSGQSIERYIMIDEPYTQAYPLPNFECSYVLMIQGSGERTIILKPSKECGHFCRTVSVVLKPSYVLWYNWWYWRPLSLPGENVLEPSISYITSYC